MPWTPKKDWTPQVRGGVGRRGLLSLESQAVVITRRVQGIEWAGVVCAECRRTTNYLSSCIFAYVWQTVQETCTHSQENLPLLVVLCD